MHTFAQKPKAPQRTTPAKPTIRGRAHVGHSQEMDSILHLQRMIGKQAVQRMLQTHAEVPEARSTAAASPRFAHDFSRIPVHSSAPRGIQPKLMVNTPGDIYEQEADRVSEQVMRMPEPQLQRDCACGETCPTCQTQQLGHEHERLQTERSQASDIGEIPAPPIVHDVMRSLGQPLDPATRDFMELRLGHDFSGVRVHTDVLAARSAEAVSAHAYTVGSDVVFGSGRYAPTSRDGQRLIAHELAHVVQQRAGVGAVQRRPAPAAGRTEAREPTEADRREFVRGTIDFLTRSAEYFGSPDVKITQAVFERVINGWYSMAVNQEKIIDDDLGGDVLLKRELRAAYTAAIRVLITRAAAEFNRSEDELYIENSGRIPMYAWQTPHRLEPGFSTPLQEGRMPDILSSNVEFATGGFDVTILPDGRDPALGNRAETRININWTAPGYSWEMRGGRRIVTRVDAVGPVTARIQTFYGPGVTAASPSGYGRGTTPEDIEGGKVTPRSTSLGFHEGSHGLDFVRYLESHAAPVFTGTVGMTEAAFLAARTRWVNDLQQYQRDIKAYSTRLTDCVGKTIDQFNAENGFAVAAVCVPAAAP